VIADCKKLNYILCELEGLPVPTICMMNGTALGGGLELALACDYRIADATNCREIGFPEVKIGVLPGAGGCIRLPRLIRLKDAIQLLVTGRSINAKAAHKIGLVDALFSNTSSQLYSNEGEGVCGMKLAWMKELRECLAQGTIGRRAFCIKKHQKPPNPTEQESIMRNIKQIFSYSREEAECLISEDYVCEQKFQQKFPLSFMHSNSLSQGIIFTLAKRSIQQSVGLSMPAPYGCLETTAKCLKMATLKQAIDVNAKGFCDLVITAESKCLMGLFLQTRKTRKEAEKFGCHLEEVLDKDRIQAENICIVLPISPGEEQNPACLAQSCLFSGIRVVFVEVHTKEGGRGVSKWRTIVEKEFGYAVKRGHWTKEQVGGTIDALVTCTSEDSFSEIVCDLPPRVFVVALNSSVARCTSKLLTVINSTEYKGTACVVAVDDGSLRTLLSDVQTVSVSLFAPLRRATQSVEVYSQGHLIASDVRDVASLLKMLRKLPIVSNTLGISVESVLLVEFWLSCCVLVESAGLSRADVDRIAKSVGGFQQGPFQVMEEFGSGNLKSLCACADRCQERHHSSYSALQAVLVSHFKQGRKGISLSNADIDLYLKMSCVKAAISVKKLCTAENKIEDSIIDVISVSGSMRFPPQEGGPLCFMYRNGPNKLKKKLTTLGQEKEQLALFFPLISSLGDVEPFEMTVTADENEFQWEELYSAGRCHGAKGPFDLPAIPWYQLLVLMTLIVLYVFYIVR
jgi:3-hydroxyacyl-CoA dehydrogenase